MKNTVQVPRNGATKPASIQTKTARAATLGAENVLIQIKDEDGKPFADFKIPETFYDAMLRDSKVKGIDLQVWIENAVREKLKSSPQAHPKPDDLMTLVAFNPEIDFWADKDEYQGIAAQIKLPVSVFNRLAEESKHSVVSLAAVIERACPRSTSADALQAFSNIESSVEAVAALVTLLQEKVLEHRKEIGVFDGEHKFGNGLAELANSSICNLKTSCQTVANILANQAAPAVAATNGGGQ